jgi:hypothetical protein
MEDTLSIDDIVLNLKMISKIKQNDKLVVINKILNVDCRLALPLRRWYTADNREDTMNFISVVIHRALEMMEDTEDVVYTKDTIKDELLNTLPGLDNLSATYKLDNLVVVRIDLIKDKINRLCGSHSKT